MTKANLSALIKSTLKIPVYTEADSITYPSATVEFYLDTPGIYGDGHATGRVKSAQVDLWYTDRASRDAAVLLLTSALDTAAISSPTVTLRYDVTARKFRATYHFETI